MGAGWNLAWVVLGASVGANVSKTGSSGKISVGTNGASVTSCTKVVGAGVVVGSGKGVRGRKVVGCALGLVTLWRMGTLVRWLTVGVLALDVWVRVRVRVRVRMDGLRTGVGSSSTL